MCTFYEKSLKRLDAEDCLDKTFTGTHLFCPCPAPAHWGPSSLGSSTSRQNPSSTHQHCSVLRSGSLLKPIFCTVKMFSLCPLEQMAPHLGLNREAQESNGGQTASLALSSGHRVYTRIPSPTSLPAASTCSILDLVQVPELSLQTWLLFCLVAPNPTRALRLGVHLSQVQRW